MADQNSYSEANIKGWIWYEHIRKRPGMYIGSLNNKGFIRSFEGFLANNFQQFQSNYALIEFQDENFVKLRFENNRNKISDDWAITREGSLHPFEFETQILNALSRHFSVQFYSKNGDEILHQKFEKGILTEGKIEAKELEAHTFEIRFQLDEEIWSDNFEWNQDYLMNEIKTFAYLHKDRKFEIHYSVEGEPCKVIYHFKNGLKDRIDLELLNGHGRSHFNTSFTDKIGDFSLEVAFAFRDYSVDEAFLKSYVNDYHTHENGSHVDGLLKGLTYGVMKYFQKYELTQQYKISEKGMREHLVAALNIKMDTPHFSGCVRNKLANTEIIEPIANYVADLFFKKIEADREATEKLIRKFKIY